jgi:beta-lactamase class D
MTKVITLIITLMIASSCNRKEPVESGQQELKEPTQVMRADVQPIFDSAKVSGAIFVFDPQQNIYYSNDFERSTRGFLPASTFKIPNSIIALETGVVENDSALFKWNGEKRRLKIWEKDMTFREAFHASCVPCYQEVARGIGVEKMNHYLNKFQYGSMLVDSLNIDSFWLEGDSEITMKQQVEFLQRFYNSQLGLSNRTETIMKELMVIEENQQYRLSGKTGWSIREGNNVGWFVGYAEIKNDVYFFATTAEPEVEFNMDLFPLIRKEITMKALGTLGIITP